MPESLAMIHSSEFAPTTRRRSISPSEFEGERLSRGNAMHSDSEPVSVRPPPSGPKPSQSHRCRTKPNGRRAGGAVSSGCLGRRATGVAKCGRVLAPRWTSQSHLCIKVTEKSLSGSQVLRVNSMTKKWCQGVWPQFLVIPGLYFMKNTISAPAEVLPSLALNEKLWFYSEDGDISPPMQNFHKKIDTSDFGTSDIKRCTTPWRIWKIHWYTKYKHILFA